MSRLTIPATIDATPAASQPGLNAVQKQLGSVPNLFRLVAQSPALLNAYLSFSQALSTGLLDGKTRERIALAVAQVNGCEYCLAAHTYLGTHVAKLDASEIAANRRGGSTDAKADAAVRFAVAVTEHRGRIDTASLQAVKTAGYSEAEILEIIGVVALNIFTNTLNNVAQTDVDFPVVSLAA
ncbi:MAG: carboxymuconolactone decarboxylase family protein [Elstera sp.]